MKKVPNEAFQIVFRSVVLCGVLIGLLFSCGEGIRLLPFPATEATKSDSSELNVEDKLLYQYNIYRLEDRQGNQKTKSQRSSQNHYWIENGKSDSSAFFISRTWRIFKFPSVGKHLKLPLFSESGESRAPPFTI